MYYKKRKMVAERKEELELQQCFHHRLSKIPLVGFSIDQIQYYYDKAKNFNRPMNATLNLAENTVKFAAAKTEPFRKLMDGLIVATNKTACQQLEKIEKRYPVIMTTPEEVMKYGKDYYDKSYLKSAVHSAVLVKEFGETKAKATMLKAVQLASNTFVGVSDFAYKCSSPFMPEGIEKNVVLAIQYAHDLNENFGKATTLTELKDEVVKEAKEKFVFVQHVALAVFDQASVYPPMSWLAVYLRGKNGDREKYLINGEIIDGPNVSSGGRRMKKD